MVEGVRLALLYAVLIAAAAYVLTQIIIPLQESTYRDVQAALCGEISNYIEFLAIRSVQVSGNYTGEIQLVIPVEILGNGLLRVGDYVCRLPSFVNAYPSSGNTIIVQKIVRMVNISDADGCFNGLCMYRVEKVCISGCMYFVEPVYSHEVLVKCGNNSYETVQLSNERILLKNLVFDQAPNLNISSLPRQIREMILSNETVPANIILNNCMIEDIVDLKVFAIQTS